MPRITHALWVGTALATLLAAPALAQVGGGAELEEVIVVAKKRETALQTTSGAISALGAEALEKQGVRSIADLKSVVPNVSIGEARLAANNIVAIRGISGQDGGQDEPVGIYLDGVYLSRPQSHFFALVDIERIEVLKGPQGTLYGRNSTAGAINIITRKPGQTTEGMAFGSVANFDTYQVKGSIEGGLTPTLSGRLSFNYADFGGDLRNTLTGAHERQAQDGFVRGVLRYEADDRPTVDLSVDYARAEGATALKNMSVEGGNYGDPETVALDLPVRGYNREAGGFGLTITQALGDLELVSVTGYRKLDFDVVYDADASNIAAFQAAIARGLVPASAAILRDSRSFQAIASDQFSQELRLSGKTGRLDWMVGLYGYHETSDFAFDVNFLAQSANVASSRTRSANTATSYAAFTHLNYALTDRVEIEAGLRYSYERKEIDRDVFAAAGGGSRVIENLEDSWSQVTGDVSLNFKPTEDVFVYLTAAQGFKSGGFNNTQPKSPSFGPENVVSYEAGVKTALFDHRARINLSVFHMDYDDLQVRFVAGLGQIIIRNAAKAKIDGAELETSAKLTPGLLASFNLAYLDARYDQFLFGAKDFSGHRLNQAPKWSLRAALNYARELPNGGEVRAQAAYAWQAREFYRAENDPLNGNPGYETVDARLGVSPFSDRRLSLEIWGKNLTDDRYVGAVIPLAGDLAYVGSINRGRTYGLDLKYAF